jgi:hypothetical protein
LAGIVIVLLPAQPQFQFIHARQHLVVELPEHGRISREAAGIEALHFADQFLEIGQWRRLSLEALAQLVQLAHGFLVSTLNFFRRGGHWLRFATLRPVASSIAAVPLAIDRTSAAGPSSATRAANWPAVWTAIRRARRTGASRLAVVTLSRLSGLAALTWLTGLTALISAKLVHLARLSRLALLTLLAITSRGITHAARESFHLAAKLLDLIERLLRILLLAIEGLLRLVQLIIEALHTRRNTVIAERLQFLAVIVGTWVDAAANPVGALFEAVLEIARFHTTECLTQLARGSRLRSAQTSGRFLHLLLEPSKRIGGLLAVVAELGLLLALA